MRLASAIAFVLATVLGAMAGHDAKLTMDIAANREATAPLSALEEQALKPKNSFKECAQCPEMVVVPAGSFTMGSPDSEEGRIEEEGPQHRVTFGKAFGVGKCDGDVRGVGCMRRGWRLQRLHARG